ncbi:TPA: hypothetical protein U1152_001051, partial [Streptococcus suis]|nr:hypothetical protein [Streptococcus suis]
YWKKINEVILQITGDSVSNFKSFLESSEKEIFNFVLDKIKLLEKQKQLRIKDIESEIKEIPEEMLRETFLRYRQEIETKDIITFKERIEKFRLTKDKKSTAYLKFIESGFE